MSRNTLTYDIAERAERIVGLRHERPGNYFMGQLQNERLIVAPGTFCARGAQFARQVREEELSAGRHCHYNAIYGSGYSIASALWGVPDMGHHNLTMMEMIGKFLVAAGHPLPLILDAETGFGTEVTLAWTVEAYDRMGVAVAHLEDQAGTRRCGNLSGKRICELDVMLAKIRAWLEHTYNLGSSMRLMVRTDALTAMDGGIDVAIDRMRRYLDVEYRGFRPAFSWADAMMKPEHIEKWCREMERTHPHVVRGLNYSPNKDWTGYYRGELGREDPPTYEELFANGDGFSVQWHTILQERAMNEAVWNTFQQMAREGAKALWDLHDRQRGTYVGETQKVSNFVPWQSLEKRIGGDEAAERYKRSEGYGADRTS
ncbi:MAG TPA: isocitrate lyase/PEP mutase family protein [Candidatus Paceibacterota bacterium]|nr:isocitrate lyase/PEP mutase family protein [Candidatus Paceibacterota bacterium]